MKPAAFYVLLAILLVALIACSNTDDPINYEDLLGVVWNIDSLQTPDTTIAASKIDYSTIQFTEDLGVIGHVDLNEYQGIYEITGNGLLIDVVEPTGWGCSRPRMRCIFFDALETVTAYEVNEDRLCLYQGDSYILYFHPSFIEEELLDKVWKVDSLQTLETKIVPGDTLMTIQFNKNMIVNGLAACNEYTGIYEIGDNRSIAIDVLTSTEMDCGPRLVDILEENFINSLEKIVTYDINEDRLTLYDSGQQYMLSFSIGAVDKELIDAGRTVWQLDSLQTPEAMIVPDTDTRITISLNIGLGVRVEGACGGYRGVFSNLEKGALAIEITHKSPWACGGEAESLDAALLEALEKIGYYDIDQNQLTLHDSNRDHVLYFHERILIIAKSQNTKIKK